MIKVLVFIFLFGSIAQAHHEPEEDNSLQTEFDLRYIINDTDSWTYLTEIKMRENFSNRFYGSFRLGAYYRVFANLKVGAFYLRQNGARHDDDWVPPAGGGWQWEWENSQGRGEDEFMVDISPRALFGKNTVAEIKTRYVYNFHNDQETLKVRPGVTYFYTRKGQNFINFYAHYEQYIPINNSGANIYEEWFYVGLLYHYRKRFKPGLFIAHREVTWTASESFKQAFPNEKFLAKSSPVVFGVTLTWFRF